jgi:hypothetical protein
MPDAEDEVSPSLPRKGARGAKREESTIEDIMKLCDVVRERGFAIHRYHKHGHLEKVYENAQASAKALADEHVAQILGYLRSSRVEPGLRSISTLKPPKATSKPAQSVLIAKG